ncbi:T9SS type A sorting domain-containing protein [bacterium]|nr:T9SS type A sorting domain-containing protein [bacterium]
MTIHPLLIPHPAVIQVLQIKSGQRTRVIIKIYDTSGRIVKLLLDSSQERGKHQIVWKGTDNSGNKAPSGIYFCSLKTGKTEISHKIVLLK